MKIRKNKIKKRKKLVNKEIGYLENKENNLENKFISNLEKSSLDDIEIRFKKVEGQMKGIYRMIKDKRDCYEIILQIIAVKSALNSLAIKLLDEHIKSCIEPSLKNNDYNIIKSFLNLLDKILKNF